MPLLGNYGTIIRKNIPKAKIARSTPDPFRKYTGLLQAGGEFIDLRHSSVLRLTRGTHNSDPSDVQAFQATRAPGKYRYGRELGFGSDIRRALYEPATAAAIHAGKMDASPFYPRPFERLRFDFALPVRRFETRIPNGQGRKAPLCKIRTF